MKNAFNLAYRQAILKECAADFLLLWISSASMGFTWADQFGIRSAAG